MNPFDLRGPEFLLFYAVLSVVVIGLLTLVRRRFELREGQRVKLTDPYLIAHLRGGPQEAIRVATVSLIDRGLIESQTGGRLSLKDASAEGLVQHPVEKAVVACLA